MNRLLDLQADYATGNREGVVTLILECDEVRDLLVAVAQSADYARINVLLADRVIAAVLPLFVARNLRQYVSGVYVTYDLVQDTDARDAVYIVYNIHNGGNGVSGEVFVTRHDVPVYKLQTSRYREDNVGVVSSPIAFNREIVDLVYAEHLSDARVQDEDGRDIPTDNAECLCSVCAGARWAAINREIANRTRLIEDQRRVIEGEW